MNDTGAGSKEQLVIIFTIRDIMYEIQFTAWQVLADSAQLCMQEMLLVNTGSKTFEILMEEKMP